MRSRPLGSGHIHRGGRAVTPFDYFMIFVTIIIALAIEAVAKDIDTLIAARHRIRWHWMALATALNSILLILSQFWLFWALRQHSPFNNYLRALSPVATMLVLFLAASAALPSQVPDEGLDLREWYFANRARYWGLGVALMGCFTVTNAIVYATHAVPGPLPLIFMAQNAVIAVLCGTLIWTRAAWWHGLCIVLFLAAGLAGNAGLTLQ